MSANWNGTSFWTAVFGLVAALVTLVAAMGGILGISERGTSAGGDGVEPIPPTATAGGCNPSHCHSDRNAQSHRDSDPDSLVH